MQGNNIGRLSNHKECAKCNEICTRMHVVECCNMEAKIHELVDPQFYQETGWDRTTQNIVDFTFQKLRWVPDELPLLRLIADLMHTARTECMGYTTNLELITNDQSDDAIAARASTATATAQHQDPSRTEHRAQLTRTMARPSGRTRRR